MTETPELAAFAARMPIPAELERRFRVLAVLEAMLTDRYPRYTYSRAFPPDPSYRLGRFDNGGGDAIAAFFGDEGAFVRAFDHEDDMSPYRGDRLWPGLLYGLPDRFAPFASVPELDDEDAYPSITVALWDTGDGWRHGAPAPTDEGDEPEPTTWMFGVLAGDFTADRVAADLGDYFGRTIDPEALTPFLAGRPLTFDRVTAVTREPTWAALGRAAEAASYPSEL